MIGRTRGIRFLSVLCCAALAACSSHQQQPGELSADSRLRIAQAAEEGGDPELAAAMYGAAAASSNSDATVQLRVASGLARAGKIPQAEEALRLGLAAHPGQPDLLRAMGLVHLVGGPPEQAGSELTQVLAIRPNDVPTMVDKAVALDMSRHHAEAQQIYRQALALAPDDPEIRNNMAVSMMLEGRLAEAEAQLAPMKYSEASSERMKNNLGVIYAATGDTGEARRLLGDGISAEALTVLTRAIPKLPASSAIVQ